jgi:NAD(P)-dependent dehydrogenase (short-subunit alcohol dehydrogenase family)
MNDRKVMATQKFTLSKDGIELQFAANHIGHFLLTNLLMPLILAAAPGSRIVNLTSQGYYNGGVHFSDPNFAEGKEYNPWYGYSQAKTANILFTYALAKRLGPKGVSSFAVNPGLILETNLQDHLTQEDFAVGVKISQDVERQTGKTLPPSALRPKPMACGTATSIFGALAPELEESNGAFLDDVAVLDKQWFREPIIGEEKPEMLWELSEKLVGEKFDW